MTVEDGDITKVGEFQETEGGGSQFSAKVKEVR